MKYANASSSDVLDWLGEEIFTVSLDGEVFKGDKPLSVRINKRKRSELGDPRVDLFHEGKRKSLHVSHLVWMSVTFTTIPVGFEIHHIDGDPYNNRWDNLMVVHPLDHRKLHGADEVEDEVPF